MYVTIYILRINYYEETVNNKKFSRFIYISSIQ